jgi:hypothetical protein
LYAAEDVLAGPIVRRVAADRATVWLALRKPAQVTLSIYAHAHGVTGATDTPIGERQVGTMKIGAELHICAPTVTFGPPTNLPRLTPGAIYDYDITIDGSNLAAMGFLMETTIAGHRHLPLGYAPGLLPAFAVPPATVEELVFAHGSCRRPYADGLDALVALDQVIEGSREGGRPHYLFFTGDQIYADDLSDEMLAWASELGVKLVGINRDGDAIERLRVDLPATGPVEQRFARLVSFPADRNHFPPGRRQRIASRCAALTSDDNQNHAFTFGELAAHYLMSWSNVVWPVKLDDPQKWQDLHTDRGRDVEAYLTAWHTTYANARTQNKANVTAKRSIDGDPPYDEYVGHIDAWKLLPAKNRAIDRFGTINVQDWGDATNPKFKGWVSFWAPHSAPGPSAPQQLADMSTPNEVFVGAPDDLRDLANAMTPAWYAGHRHFGIDLDYKVAAKDAAPADIHDLEFASDSVLERLKPLRIFYEGLPYARRALANVSTLMMFDDHEVTDDWTTTRKWVTNVRKLALGRDVMTNGMAAYLLFQDLGNDVHRYDNDSPNARALQQVEAMFVDGAGNLREQGPPPEVRTELERLFNFPPATDASRPLPQQATWNFQITDPSSAPYEIALLDNRTKRGYDSVPSPGGDDLDDAPPADLSLEAIATQIQATPPAGSKVSIFIAPLPVVGYPPMEELVQPLAMVIQGHRNSPDPKNRHGDTFPWVDIDYEFGALFDDPEAWDLNQRAQEALFARLSSRPAVVLLSGDIHFSMTGKVTYWTAAETPPNKLVPTMRLVQLVSSALKNIPSNVKQMNAQIALAEQIATMLGGPYDRFGWAAVTATDGPNFDTTGAGLQLQLKMQNNPAVIPARMLPKPVYDQLRTTGLERPPQWAWRFDLVKDVRPDAIRYEPFATAATEIELPDESALTPATIQQIANHHAWNASLGMPRRSFWYSNIALVQFERENPADPSSPLSVVQSLYAWDRTGLGPGGGAPTPNTPWPDARLPASTYTAFSVSFDLTDEIAPDMPDPTGRT